MDLDGYRALRKGAALLDLTGRGHIQATGEDRVRLLHAMSTNHISALAPGDWVYAFFLNSQGRILADVNVICTESSLLLDTEPETGEAIYQHLDRYIIADDVTLTNLSGQVAVIGVEGPEAAVVLDRMGIAVPEAGHWTEWRTWVVAAISASGERGFRLFVPLAERENVAGWAAGAGAIPVGREEWNTVRLENGVPRYGEDITDRQIPHDTGLVDRAISFSKGCYLGQEIVERVRSRGHAGRKLLLLRIEGEAAPAAHTKLFASGEEVGEVTSAAYSPAAGAVLALAYVRAKTVQPGVVYAFEDGGAAIIEPRS
jgi:aminomethyltransferase